MSNKRPESYRAAGAVVNKIKLHLRGRLATRTFLLFVVCALIPLALTGILTIRQTSSYLEEQANRSMRMRAKSYGLQLFERLSLAADLVRNTDGLQSLVDYPLTNVRYIDSIGLFHDGQIQSVTGKENRLPTTWNGPSPTTLSEGKPALWAQPDADQRSTVYMLYRPRGSQHADVLIAALNDDYLWQPISDAESYVVCVTDSRNVTLRCSNTVATYEKRDIRGGDYISADWNLFLRGKFETLDWSILTYQSRNTALAVIDYYKQILLTAMLGSLALIALFSSIIIRRSHQPLATLISATRRIANGQFNATLNVNSGDEYQELSQAFNIMSERLGRQFHTISVLGKIDRLILESPNLEPVVETMLAQMRNLLVCELAAVAIFDTEAETLGRLYTMSDETFDKPQLFRMSWPMPATLSNGSDHNGYIVAHTDHGSTALQPLWTQGAQQCLLLPVTTKTRMNAILILGYRAIADVEPAQRQLARDFSDRLAVALTSAEREQALFQQAHYDALTQLPNRLLFKDRLELELAHARRDTSSVALLFIDLDRFKHINDSLGHSAGDQLLKLAAMRFACELRDIDTIARLGGDEFTVVAPQLRTPADISRLCERLLQSLVRPFVIDGHEFFVSASIGAALYPNNGHSAEELLRNADTAMYRAKSKARGSYAFYEESMNREIQERALLENQLRQALSNNELELFYQPKIELATGKTVGAEALLRWNHAENGMIDPERFIPIAEETGLIVPIGEWVINTACAQLQAWRRQGLDLQSISVNVAVPQLQAPGFTQRVQRILRTHQIQPGMLELEVTESTLATDIETTADILCQLSSAGVHLAIDDFGTGYSSLSYLQRLPIDVMKIDRAFMPQKFDGKDHLICEAVLALAHTLGKTVVAEGIENAQQMLYLQSHGCQIGQGYFFGRAMSCRAFTARLLDKQPPHQQDSIAV